MTAEEGEKDRRKSSPINPEKGGEKKGAVL